MDTLKRREREKNTNNRRLLWVVVLWVSVLVVISAVFTASWFGWNIVGVRGSAVSGFAILPGQGVNEISRNLYRKGAIRSQLAFETYLWARGLEGSIIAGNYSLPGGNIVQLTDILIAGPKPEEHKVTLIEGWTIDDMARELSKQGIVDESRFLEIARKPKKNGFSVETTPILYSKPDNVDLEGYLFPDTYNFFKDVTEEDVIGLLMKTLTGRITEQMAKDIDDRGLTIHEILTMASIIEKEVRTDRDRRIVSGVLWNRINKNIALQVDSTVNYITGRNDPSVSIKATKIDNPFNTYMYKGLPPGPISNPGLSSIMAAIYPAETDYMFYLSKPNGETVFSRTFEEHVMAKNKYLK